MARDFSYVILVDEHVCGNKAVIGQHLIHMRPQPSHIFVVNFRVDGNDDLIKNRLRHQILFRSPAIETAIGNGGFRLFILDFCAFHQDAQRFFAPSFDIGEIVDQIAKDFL